MKVLLLNGSPHAAGSTYTALHEMETVFDAEGIETELLQVGTSGDSRLHCLRRVRQNRQMRL